MSNQPVRHVEMNVKTLVLNRNVNAVRWKATGTEGVFRLSANAAVVEELVGRYDRGEPVDFDAPVLVTTQAGKTSGMVDAHVIAALLKRWFRELPEPLCTIEMYDMWMAAASIKDKPTQMQQVKKVLSFLPQSNQILIKYLATFLRSFSVFSDETKMTPTNLAICFAPNLLRAPDTLGLADQIEESPIATSLLVMFIENFDDIFDHTVGIATPFAESVPPNKASSLTSNLLPPPPPSPTSNHSHSSSGPTPPLNKPTPKFTAKKGGQRSPYSREPSADPPTSLSPLPPPLSASSNSTTTSSSSLNSSSEGSLSKPGTDASLALPPPPLAPKPKNKLKRSNNGTKKPTDDASSSEIANASTPPPLALPSSPPTSRPPNSPNGANNHSNGTLSEPLKTNSNGNSSASSSPSMKGKAPPPRPNAAPPTF